MLQVVTSLYGHPGMRLRAMVNLHALLKVGGRESIGGDFEGLELCS